MTCDIIVVVDCSIDKTKQIAENLLKQSGAVLCTAVGAVGRARALGTDLVLDRYPGTSNRCWIANTDADCVVPEAWLLDQLALAETGIEAIAGTIDVDHFGEHQPVVKQRFRSSYLIHEDGSHPHVHGANLGIRADTYQRVGGWKDLVTAEDHDLWKRLVADSHVVSTNSTRVLTSGRRVGRAPQGFAAALAAHNEALA